MKKYFPGIILLILVQGLILSAFSQEHTNERALWFTDARFGMFIHWGVYSGAEGLWKEEKLRKDNDYAEWIYYRNRIAREEYTTLLNRFDWENKWLRGDQYAHMLENIDMYCSAFGMEKLGEKQHPENIYIQPESKLNYTVQSNY